METQFSYLSRVYHKKGTFCLFPENYVFQNRQEQIELLGSEVFNNSSSQTFMLFSAVLVRGHKAL